MNRLLPLLLLALVLSSCAKQYLYRFPTEPERKRYKPEELRWSYRGNTPDTIVVTNGDQLFRLAVTDETKLEVHTVYGDKHRFAFQSITVIGDGDFLGTSQLWRGYDLIAHAERTVPVKEISHVVIISATAAVALP